MAAAAKLRTTTDVNPLVDPFVDQWDIRSAVAVRKFLAVLSPKSLMMGVMSLVDQKGSHGVMFHRKLPVAKRIKESVLRSQPFLAAVKMSLPQLLFPSVMLLDC